MVRVPGYRPRGARFDSLLYRIFWVVVGLEQVSLSLVSTIEELLGRNSSRSGLESREYGHGDPLRWPHGTFYPQKLALTSLTSSGRSVGIVCSQRRPWSLFYVQLQFYQLVVIHNVFISTLPVFSLTISIFCHVLHFFLPFSSVCLFCISVPKLRALEKIWGLSVWCGSQ
jgi:hypothetical protein